MASNPVAKESFDVEIDSTGQSVTIAIGQTLSSALNCFGMNVCNILIPSGFTGTTISFYGSFDNTTYYPIYNTAGAALTATVVANSICALAPIDLAGFQFIKISSGSSQASSATLNISLRHLE